MATISGATSEVSVSSSEAKMTILKCSHKWKINNFSYRLMKWGDKLDSSTFCSETDEKIKWCLSLYPFGKNADYKDNISLYLTLVGSHKTEMTVKFKLSILNDKGEASNSYENTGEAVLFEKENKRKQKWGVDKFVSRNFLMDSANGLLHDDTLTVFVEVSAATISSNDNILHDDLWGYTQVNIVELSYLWTISNFSFCKEKTGVYIKSPVFSAKNDRQFNWYLGLFPNGLNEPSKDCLSIFLYPGARPQVDVLVKYKIKILHARNRNADYSHREIHHTFESDCRQGRGFSRFIQKHLLTSDLLPDDKLTIHCAIKYSTGATHITGSIQPTLMNLGNLVVDDLNILLKNGKFSDVILAVGDRELQAHKAILAARSPVFSAIFEHNSEESSNGKIQIVDMDYELLQEFVGYIYTGISKNLPNMVMRLLPVADYYILEGLKLECEQELCLKINPTNAVEMLILADKYSLDKLKTQSVELINTLTEVINSKGFKRMSTSHPHLMTEIKKKKL